MEMNYKSENRQLTITLTGELDHHAAKGLMDSIDRCIKCKIGRASCRERV